MKKIKAMGGRIWSIMGQANENEISFFDIKTLYDAAYEEKEAARAALRRYAAMKEQAEMLEKAYRAQLAARKPGPSAVRTATDMNGKAA